MKKELSLLLCIAVTLCAMSSTALAVSAEPIKEADPVTAMITAADTLPGISAYEVYSVSKIGVDDTSVLNDSTENIITLVTCVMNQPDYRWCVQAREK